MCSIRPRIAHNNSLVWDTVEWGGWPIEDQLLDILHLRTSREVNVDVPGEGRSGAILSKQTGDVELHDVVGTVGESSSTREHLN